MSKSILRIVGNAVVGGFKRVVGPLSLIFRQVEGVPLLRDIHSLGTRP